MYVMFLMLVVFVSPFIDTCANISPKKKDDCWTKSTASEGCCYLSKASGDGNPICKSYKYDSYPRVSEKISEVVYKIECPLKNNPFYYLLPCYITPTKYPKCELNNSKQNYCCQAWSKELLNFNCFYSNNTQEGNFTMVNNEIRVKFVCKEGGFYFLRILLIGFLAILIFA